MAEIGKPPEICQLHFMLRGINPLVWRRVFIRSDSKIADPHYILQIAFHWTEFHHHRFLIRGKALGFGRAGCTAFPTPARKVCLADFHFRLDEQFVYEYDFGDLWEHHIRFEGVRPLEARKFYSVCLEGARAAPPEDCGGPWAHRELMDHYGLNPPRDELQQVADALEWAFRAKGHEKVRDVLGDVDAFQGAGERVEASPGFGRIGSRAAFLIDIKACHRNLKLGRVDCRWEPGIFLRRDPKKRHPQSGI